MSTSPAHTPDHNADNPHMKLLERRVGSLEELNARIARLAMGLGLSLRQEPDIQRVITYQAPHVSLERRSQSDRRTGPRAVSSDRRASRQWEELRGLIVLRYELEVQYAQELGASVTREIFTEASDRLARDGFAVGLDGIDLKKLFGNG
jgi:hypothetical protein